MAGESDAPSSAELAVKGVSWSKVCWQAARRLRPKVHRLGTGRLVKVDPSSPRCAEVERPRVRSYDGHEVATGGRLAWPLGHEPDADQRVDAQAQACGAAARGRSAGHCRGRHLEVSGLAAGRGNFRLKAGPVGDGLT